MHGSLVLGSGMFMLLVLIPSWSNSVVTCAAIIIAVFSGGWPYLKLLLCFFCWVSPVAWLSGAFRVSDDERAIRGTRPW
jgi:hypothetical protein